MLSVVIPTRNEAANIAACLRSFEGSGAELVVVDNSSEDATAEIAAGLGARVFTQGPERCAQRNRGWREAKGDWILFLDADMILPRATVEEALAVASQSSVSGADAPSAYWIPEVRTGKGLRTKARNFERSFYDATVIDGFRLIRREVLERTGGYDEKLVACEDWDLDIRILALGTAVSSLRGHLVHNEARLTFGRTMEKKAYYAASFAAYREKWAGHPAVRKQFSVWYRFVGVFTENGKWKRLLAHPVLAAVMYAERFCVGLVYLARS